jgi:hypothetical protein
MVNRLPAKGAGNGLGKPLRISLKRPMPAGQSGLSLRQADRALWIGASDRFCPVVADVPVNGLDQNGQFCAAAAALSANCARAPNGG